jgi:hypothetical protein
VERELKNQIVGSAQEEGEAGVVEDGITLTRKIHNTTLQKIMAS